MKSKSKRFLSLVLAAVMVLSMLPAVSPAADAAELSAEPILEFDFSNVTTGSNGAATVTGTAYGGKTITAEAQNVTFKDGVAVFAADSGATITCTPGSDDPMKNLIAGDGATVSMWIKTTEDSFVYDLIAYGGVQSSGDLGASLELLAVSNQDHDATVYYRNESGSSQNQKITSYSKDLYKPGQWQLVTLVESTSNSTTTLTLYVDGELCGTRTQSNKTLQGFATDSSADTYYIGYKPTAAAEQYFVGEMDSVTVYNKALSQEEIAALYEDYFKAITVLDSDWEVEKQNENLAINSDGSITITTEAGTIGDSNGMNNVLYQKIPNSTDYNFTVKVSGSFTQNFQGAYLMIASGKNLENAVGVVRRYHGYLGGNYGTNLLMGVMNDGVSPSEYYTGAADIGNEFYLRLQKNNDRITGYYAENYSEDDSDWTQIIDTTKDNVGYINKGNGLVSPDEIYIAVGAANGGGNTATQITFSDLRIDGIPYAFATTTSALKEVSLTAPDKIDVGASAKLTLNGTDYNGEAISDFDSVTYSSNDEEVATVDGSGVVKGHSGGYATITVTASKGGITKSASTQVQIGEIVVEDSWTVTSPNGYTSLTVERITGGTIQYHAEQGNVTNIPTSPMGLVTNLGDFSKKLVVESVSEVTEINESYSMISGKSDVYYNHCNEQTITFTRKDNTAVKFDVVIRAYNDGTAFRYGIRGENGKELRISDETTGLQLPSQATVYWMNYANARWNYESNYNTTTTEGLEVGSTPSIPMLYGKSGVWTLFTEANLSGSYCGSMTRVAEDGMLNVEFAPLQSGDVVTTVPFESPWRAAITGSVETIVENNLIENLNEPADYDTYAFNEWVDPGMSSWSWVTNWGSGVSDQTKAETHLKWIQLAADMGWEYYILDEGWNPGGRGNAYGFRDWWPEVRDFAAEKGVKLIAWVHVSDIDTQEERDAHFKEWSENGIVGIKADFFDGESQEKMQIYDDLYRDAAKYRLMVNCHGANKPTGEIRTWPNVFAREGIKGQEAGGITSEQYTIIPFIRGAIGPADVTEELRSKDYNKTTMGFQVALTALFEDGIHSMGSSPEVYESVPEALTYYVDYPDEWDQTELVSAEVAKYINMARRSGDDWYLSGITVSEREMDLSLSFLEKGTTYTAQLFKENGRQDIDMEVIEGLTRDDSIHVSMLYGGGYAVRLVPTDSSGIHTIVVPEEVTVEIDQSVTVDITVEPEAAVSKDVVWSSADESIATVDNGVIKGIAAGTTVVTVAAAHDDQVNAQIQVTVTAGPEETETGWTILNANDNAKITGATSVTITTQPGVLNDTNTGYNNLFAIDVPEGDEDFEITAKISGGLNADYQGGFLTVFDKANPAATHVAVGRRHHSYFSGSHPQILTVMSHGSDFTETWCLDENGEADLYLKLVKKGETITAYYSLDGETWHIYTNNNNGGNGAEVAVTNANLAAAEQLCVGFYAACGGGNTATDITISKFTYNGTVLPVAVCSHENTEIVGKVSASASKDGYSGDKVCLDCEVTVEQGQVIPAAVSAILEFDFSDYNTAAGTVNGIANGKTITAEAKGVTFTTDDAGNDVMVLPEGGDNTSAGIVWVPGEDDPMKTLVDGEGVTINLWIKSSVANFNSPLLTYGQGLDGTTLDYCLQLMARGGSDNADVKKELVLYRGDNGSTGGQKILNVELPIQADQWHLYSFVENADGTSAIYLDGELMGTSNNTSKSVYDFANDGNADCYYIGCAQLLETKDSHFTGAMDSLTVYNGALSEEKLVELYNEREVIEDPPVEETVPEETVPEETESEETVPEETVPEETEPEETVPEETEPEETEPEETPSVTIDPILIEAENYNTMKGVQTESCDEGGSNVGYIETGDWMSYHDVDIPEDGTYLVEFRVASPNSDGVLRLEKDAGATNLGEVSIPNTGGWQSWTTVSLTVKLTAGKQQIGIAVPTGGWNINWIRFTKI